MTGAARGLGRCHALALAADGVVVVVNDVDNPQPVVDEIVESGGMATANDHDVSTFAGADALVEHAFDRHGDLHVLVNNAGLLRKSPVGDIEEADLDATLTVNVKGTIAPVRAVIRRWRHRGRTSDLAVINTSSASGLHGSPLAAPYAATKAAVASLTISASQELERFGIRVNAIMPAARTAMVSDPRVRALMAPPPEGEFDPWRPENVAPLVVALAREGCPVTGRLFRVPGGTVALYRPAIADVLVDEAKALDVNELARLLGSLEADEVVEDSAYARLRNQTTRNRVQQAARHAAHDREDSDVV